MKPACLIFTLIFLASCSAFRTTNNTKVLYSAGNIKTETKKVFYHKTDIIIQTDKEYYKNGNLKSSTLTKYKNPDKGNTEIDPSKKLSLILYKKEKEYYENGKIKSEAALKKGDGEIKEYNENGKLTTIKTIRHFVPAGTKKIE
jgi:antitoxin component YwqK of YwqJK toxin-antitoxin module